MSKIHINKMSAIDEATLLKMAEAEILGEAKRAAVRHSIAGISGWQACPKPNKIFLTNTLLQAMTSNRLQSRKQEGGSRSGSKTKNRERKLLNRNQKNERNNFIYKKPVKKDSQSNCDSVKTSFTKTKVTSKVDKSQVNNHRQKLVNTTRKKP